MRVLSLFRSVLPVPARLLAGLTLLLGMLASSLPAWALNASDLLPPEKAFPAQVTRAGNTLTITFDVADGYYLYRDRLHFSSEPAGLVGNPQLPPGKVKQDRFFGAQTIYHGKTVVTLPLKPGAPSSFTLNANLQGCATAGICYPPYTHKLKVGQRSTLPGWLSDAASGSPSPTARPTLATQGWLSTLGTFLLAGLGMAFTACMYPLLPIVSSLIAGEGHVLTRRRGLALSFTYVQGLALTYTSIGIIAGLTGSLLTVWLQQPAVVLSASALMVVFALSMFDLFSIQLPAALQSRLAETSNRLSGGKAATVFLMGAFSALIIGPCVAPPLALALGYIGSTGDALLGGAALYSMALGLGLPLIVIGTFGGHILPRAGSWMNVVKSLFGVVMLASAIWLATPFLPAIAVMLLWATLLIGTAVFLKTFENLPANAHVAQRLGKALGLMLFLIGAAQVVGVLAGEDNPRYPLRWLASKQAQAATLSQPDFLPTTTPASFDSILAQARAQGKPVLLDFYADWCISCKELEADTFPHPQVKPLMQKFVRVRADVTAGTANQQDLLKRFGLFGPPGVILFDGRGKEAGRIIGFTQADEFAHQLQRAL